jgi:hypothetical protein
VAVLCKQAAVFCAGWAASSLGPVVLGLFYIFSVVLKFVQI